MKKEKVKTRIGEADTATIERWKHTHRRVIEVEVREDDSTHVCYFRRPDMDTLAAVNKVSKTDEVKGVCVLFDNCWLGGSEEVRDDALLKMNAVTAFNSLLGASMQVEVKNL